MKMKGNCLRCQTANKFLNIHEWVEVELKNEDGPFPFHAVLSIVIVCERKSRLKQLRNCTSAFQKKQVKHDWFHISFTMSIFAGSFVET